MNYKPLAANRPKSPSSSDNSSKSTSPMKSNRRSVLHIKELKSGLQAVHRIQRELDSSHIQLIDAQNKLLKQEMNVESLKDELKSKDKENAMLKGKLQECSRKLEGVMLQANELEENLVKERKVNQELSLQLKELESSGQVCQCEDLRKENMDLRSKLYRLLQRYKDVTQRCERLEKHEVSSIDNRSKISNEELQAMEKQIREIEECQNKLLNENADLKNQLVQANFSRYERILKLSNRLYKINHELSQLLVFLKAFQTGETLTISALLGLQTIPKKSEVDSDVVQLCDDELDQMAATLDQFRGSLTMLL